MDIFFEAQRLFVAPRQGILFFARVGDERIRCYVRQDALVEPPRSLREQADLFQRCLLAFDQHRAAIESAAARLIGAGAFDPDGAVSVDKVALDLATDAPLGALNLTK